MFARYFTPKEANRLLTVVKPLVAQILAKGKALRSRLESDASFMSTPEAHKMQEDMAGLMAELENMGCYFKDWNFEIGLVDFPAIVDGQEALLCWRSDEGEILWYHGLEDGYPGRRPIPEYWLLDMGNLKEGH